MKEWSNESVEGKNLEMTEKLVSEVTKEYRSKSRWKLVIDTYILKSSFFPFLCPNDASSLSNDVPCCYL